MIRVHRCFIGIGCVIWTATNRSQSPNRYNIRDIDQVFRLERFLMGRDACVRCTLQIGSVILYIKHPYQPLVTQPHVHMQHPLGHFLIATSHKPSHSLALISLWMAIIKGSVVHASSLSLILFSLLVVSSPSPLRLWRDASFMDAYSGWTLVNCPQQLEVISWLAVKAWIISWAEQGPGGKQLTQEGSCSREDEVYRGKKKKKVWT